MMSSKHKKATTTNMKKYSFSIQSILKWRIWFLPSPSSPLDFTRIDFILLSLVSLISFVFHFLYIGTPDSCVFDEYHFGKFINFYYSRQYFFDIHPPLGKLLIFYASRVLGYDGSAEFLRIGGRLYYQDIWRVRFLPCFLGSLQTPILFLTLKLLDVSSLWSFAISSFICLDNAFIVESRFILIDSLLVFFSLLTTLFMALFSRQSANLFILAIFAGIAAGSTVSIKFTGSGTALALIVSIFMNNSLIEGFLLSTVATISGGIVFLFSFFIHFQILDEDGPGCMYHPASFCDHLRNHQLDSFHETINLIYIMIERDFAINDSHSYQSNWKTWPFMIGKSTYMWTENGKNLFCSGNPVVWYAGLIGIFAYIFCCLKIKYLQKTLWIAFGYLMSYLPFSFISRALYNYHYFIPLTFKFIGFGLAFEQLFPKSTILPLIIFWIVLIGFVIYFPITYGTMISHDFFKKIMFRSWIYHD